MHYHPGLRNHEHFSFGNQKNAVKPLRGFNYPDGEKGIIIRRESWCLYRRVKWTHNIEVVHYTNIVPQSKPLETQIGL